MTLEEIKSRINPQYQDCLGTESNERKWLCDQLDAQEALIEKLAETISYCKPLNNCDDKYYAGIAAYNVWREGK